MCGIAGYVGEANAKEIIIEGLKRIEYKVGEGTEMIVAIPD